MLEHLKALLPLIHRDNGINKVCLVHLAWDGVGSTSLLAYSLIEYFEIQKYRQYILDKF